MFIDEMQLSYRVKRCGIDDRKRQQEIAPLLKTGDLFRRYVVVDGSQEPWTDERGITYVGVIPFLLRPEILE